HVGARAAAAAREVSRGDRGRTAVRGEIETAVEPGADLSQTPVAVAVVKVYALVDLVVEHVVEHVQPVRAAWRQALDREVFGGQRRGPGKGGCRKPRPRQGRAEQMGRSPRSPRGVVAAFDDCAPP